MIMLKINLIHFKATIFWNQFKQLCTFMINKLKNVSVEKQTLIVKV